MINGLQMKKNRTRRGFSLTELVIVLGFIALITSAIWVAASSVNREGEINSVVSTVAEIATRVQTTYRGHRNASVPADMSAVISADLVPKSVVNTAADSALNNWGGEYIVNFHSSGGLLVGFNVEVTLSATEDVTTRNRVCAALLMHFKPTATDYAGGWTGIFPSDVIPLTSEEGGRPALSHIRDVGWAHVTSSTVTNAIGGLNATGCTRVAFYYKL